MYMQFCEKLHWRTLCVGYYRKRLAYYIPMTFRCLLGCFFHFFVTFYLQAYASSGVFFIRKSKRNLDKHFLFLVFWHSFYNRRLTMMSLHYTTTQTLVWNRCTYIREGIYFYIERKRSFISKKEITSLFA